MKRTFGALWAIGGIGVTLVWAALSSFLILPFAAIPRGRREKYAIRGAQWFAWMVLRATVFARIRTEGRANLPATDGYLVVCNHRSWIDVVLLQLYTKSNGVSKKEVAWIPFFGPNGYLSGAIFFDRSSKMARGRVVTDAQRLLAGGANLHVFPEGTRTRDGRLRDKVFLRLLETASEMGAPLVPAVVWGTEQVVPAEGVYAMPFQEIGIEVGPAVPRAEGESPTAHAERVWAKVREMAGPRGADGPFAEG